MAVRHYNFGLYGWFPEKGHDLVHPEDLERLIAARPPARVFDYARRDDDWISLSAADDTFRVRDDVLKPVPPPTFWIGDAVRFRSGGAERCGVVRFVAWHFKDSRPFYLLESAGKDLGKRYQESDLWSEDLTKAF